MLSVVILVQTVSRLASLLCGVVVAQPIAMDAFFTNLLSGAASAFRLFVGQVLGGAVGGAVDLNLGMQSATSLIAASHLVLTITLAALVFRSLGLLNGGGPCGGGRPGRPGRPRHPPRALGGCGLNGRINDGGAGPAADDDDDDFDDDADTSGSDSSDDAPHPAPLALTDVRFRITEDTSVRHCTHQYCAARLGLSHPCSCGLHTWDRTGSNASCIRGRCRNCGVVYTWNTTTFRFVVWSNA
jgi:hypothetical protein